MRYRNVKPQNRRITGNGRTPLLGRHVRSRLMVPLDSGRQFGMVDIDRNPPPVLMLDGETIEHEDTTVNWEMEPADPLPALPDTRPPEKHPVDTKPRGVDAPETVPVGINGSFRKIDCPSGSDLTASGDHDTLHLIAGAGVTITGSSSAKSVTFTAGGGGGVGSFKTINCPTGTDPVADSFADTLNITQGAGIVVTGNAATDTVDIASTITQYTDELAQDAVGNILDDTASVALDYDDATPKITATAIPGGIDHDALLNFDPNEHVDHTSVSIIAGSGLSGGGDISASRTLDVNVDNSTIEISTDTVQLKDDGTTFAKMQDIASDTLIGRDTLGLGNPESISLDDTLEMTGTQALQRAALSGDISAPAGSNSTTLATVNSNVGTFGSSTAVAQVTVNGKGLVTAASDVTVTPAVGSITGLGAGVATFLGTPSSANLATAVTDETGSGALVFANTPTLTTPTIGDFTNAQHDHLDADDGGVLSLPAVGISNSSTVGQVLRVTGASTYAFGAVDLSDTDAVTGDLPLGNIADGTALSILGVTGNATAPHADIAAASDHQVLRRSGTAVAFGAVNLASTNAVTGTLPFSNGGTVHSTRRWTLLYDATSVDLPNTSYAQPSALPTTLRPCLALDPDSDESFILIGIIPDEFSSSSNLRIKLTYCANATDTSKVARVGVVTEFRTAASGENLNSDNFDASSDSASLTFGTATAYTIEQVVVTLSSLAVTPVAGDEFRIKISRDANATTGTDSLLVDLLVTKIEFYEVV